MAGPLSGLGQGQQIPLSNSFQPGQNNNTQVRPREDQSRPEPQENVVQPRETQAASTQNTETGNQDAARALRDDALAFDTAGENRERGSIIDITV